MNNTKSIKRQKTVTHVEFGQRLTRAQAEKPKIEAHFAGGGTLTALAEDYGVAESAMKSILEVLGISHKKPKEDNQPSRLDPRVTDLLTVVRRIARGLDVEHSEIIKYFAE